MLCSFDFWQGEGIGLDITKLNPQSIEDIKIASSWFLKRLEVLERRYKNITQGETELTVDEIAIAEIIHRINRDEERYSFGTNLCKKGAHLTFWIRRLRPITAITLSPQFLWQGYENEILALLVGCDALNYRQRMILPKEWFSSMIYNLRYRAVSPHSIAIVYETMWAKYKPRPKE